MQPQESKEVSVSLIGFNNQDRLITRLTRDLLPTIDTHPDWNFQIIVIDNSDQKLSYDYPQRPNINHLHHWTTMNMMYGPSLNLASSIAVYPLFVYMCTNHGHMYDPTWIDDLVSPLSDKTIAMTGSCLGHWVPPGHMGFPAHLPAIHVQGGVFATRTETITKYPYSYQWPHVYSDVYQSFQLMNAGLCLCDVYSIKSQFSGYVSQPETWKYVHDYAV